MTNSLQPKELIGSELFDQAGEKVGKVGTVYVGDNSRTPEWVTVKTGLFGSKENFVPLRGAQQTEQGVQVPVTKDKVKNAPQIEADGNLNDKESTELYQYYGLRSGEQPPAGQQDRHAAPTDAPAAARGDAAAGRQGNGAGHADTEARHRDGAADGESMVRSEERMHVGTETVESGKARLRKYVVTEDQQVNVPVRHEEVRVEREPISASEQKNMQGTAIGEEEAEVVLHAERPVVQKETVAVEKVHLGTETVSGEETVSGQVRKEQFDISDPGHQENRNDRPNR